MGEARVRGVRATRSNASYSLRLRPYHTASPFSRSVHPATPKDIERRQTGRTVPGSHRDLLRVAGLEQVERIDPSSLRDPLDGLQGQVALSALDRSGKRAVDAENVSGEGFLRIAARLTNGAQVSAEGTLKVAAHVRDAGRMLLSSLQPYK